MLCSHGPSYRPDADRHPRVQVTGLVKHNDNITRHEAEPAFSVAIIVATSFHGDFDVKHEICDKHLFLSAFGRSVV
jgi:hypothetical protein